jgi:hypothetical protein
MTPRGPFALFARLCAILSLSLAAGAQITTWHVDIHNPNPPGTGTPLDPYTSIQFAIAQPQTQSGDAILVHPGVYFESIDYLGKTLAIGSSSGPASTQINGAGSFGSLVTVKSGEGAGTYLEGFTLIGGSGTYSSATLDSRGGAIYCKNSRLRISNCTIQDNATRIPSTGAILGHGGAIYAENSPQLFVLECELRNNQATRGGGIWLEASNAFVFFSQILANSALCLTSSGTGYPGWAGGLGARDSQLDFDSVLVQGNTACGILGEFMAPALGGGMLLLGGKSLILNSDFFTNKAGLPGAVPFPGQGGGIAILQTSGPGDVTILGCDFGWNSARENGGAIIGSFTMGQCKLYANIAQSGAGVYASGAHLSSCDIFENAPAIPGMPAQGLGVFVDPTTLGSMVSDTKIHDHTGFGQGLGVWGGQFVGCEIYANESTATADLCEGAGAFNASLEQCRVFGNIALGTGGLGGGLHSSEAERCLIYDNRATQAGGAHQSVLLHCTVVGNASAQAGSGAGLHDGSAENSILWNNQPLNVSGAASVTYSTVQGGWPGVGNIVSDPQFWMEPASDFHLRANSPCIDAANPASPPDANGSPADMGALTFSPNYFAPPFVYCTAKINSLGCTPEISTSGPPSVCCGGLFFVNASNVLSQQNGLLFWGRASSDLPFQGGTLCVAQPLIRTSVMSSGGSLQGGDCSGTYSFHWSEAYIASQGLLPGTRVFAQFWSRDPGSPSTTGLTNAVDFTFIP